MIYDTFENMDVYCREGDALHRAISYARDFDVLQPDGEYEVEGRDIFAKVMTCKTAPAAERVFEAHTEYVDVQVLRAGRERMDVSLGDDLEPLGPYDEADDGVLLKPPDTYASIVMEPGTFVVFYPQDAHRPGCDLEGTDTVRKICMKVRVASVGV